MGMTQVTDADWLEEAARYFEKRPTGGEDMAFWANVANAERCRSIAAALRASSGVEVKPDFYGVWSGKIHVGTWADENTARDVAEEYDSPSIVPLYASPPPTVEGRLPTREEVASAASILLMCNGHELHTWGAGDLLDDCAMHALRALSQNKGE
jgi:hypothetical protein